VLLDLFALIYPSRPGGGISSGSKGGAKKRVVVERNGKLLLFRNATDAAAFIRLENAPEQVIQKKKNKKQEIVKPIETIDISEVEQYKNRLVQEIPEIKVGKLISLSIEVLLRIAAKLRELEDDDIETLLMAA